MDSKQLQDIAYLSRLKLDGKELESMLSDFQKIMNYVEKVKELDTSAVSEEDLYPHLKENATRIDAVGDSLSRDAISGVAPQFENGYIVVPRVIET